jgi:hypothetical protein
LNKVNDRSAPTVEKNKSYAEDQDRTKLPKKSKGCNKKVKKRNSNSGQPRNSKFWVDAERGIDVDRDFFDGEAGRGSMAMFSRFLPLR